MGWLNEGSRIANATRNWQDIEDTPITGWDKANHFIIALAVGCDTHGGDSDSIKVQWRVFGGSFADLGASGAMKQSSSTDLVNTDPISSGEEGCSSALTLIDGEEIEGDYQSASITFAQNEWCEIQCAIDPGDAADDTEYEFQAYVVSDGKAQGAGSATITTAAAGGWTGKIIGVTNPDDIIGVATSGISKVIGV